MIERFEDRQLKACPKRADPLEAIDLFHDARRVYPSARYQPRPGDPTEMAYGGYELVRIIQFIENSALHVLRGTHLQKSKSLI